MLRDPALLQPIADHREHPALGQGRPTIAMETYVRLMVVKQRSGWGYETLVREVSDSLHLRRFCLIALHARVPDESTVRKLTRRLGPETVAQLTRALIEKAARERRFRPRAARIDSTVVEADIRYPTDAELALQGARALAREGSKLAARLRAAGTRVRDRSRSISRAVRLIGRTLRRRTGEAKGEVMRLNERAGRLIRRSVSEARRLAGEARRAARGRGARAKLRAAKQLEELAGRCERIAEQIAKRARGEKIDNRLVSLADPDARPIRKGKLGKPTEFGYVEQLCELTENTRRGARGLILPAASRPGNPGENTLLPQTASELERLELRPREIALDGGFGDQLSAEQLTDIRPQRIYVAGRAEPGSRRTRRRLAATAPAWRAASATSSAATACGARASKATTGSAPGPAGRSSPTTSTRSPSEPADRLTALHRAPPNHTRIARNGRATAQRAAVSLPAVYPGQVVRIGACRIRIRLRRLTVGPSTSERCWRTRSPASVPWW
jgi:transposase, IS5 family